MLVLVEACSTVECETKVESVVVAVEDLDGAKMLTKNSSRC